MKDLPQKIADLSIDPYVRKEDDPSYNAEDDSDYSEDESDTD